MYVDDSKLNPDVKAHLNDKVQLRPYDSILGDVKSLGSEQVPTEKTSNGSETETKSAPNRKFMISTKASWALSLELGGEDAVEEVRSPVGDAKAIKNDTEIAGMRACHIRDGAALTAYFAWVEEALQKPSKSSKDSLNEVQVADHLEHLRSQKSHFAGLSFDTISAVGPNAAVIHYKPEAATCSTLSVDEIYLCDSGAQYLDGTTDVTRTIHFSPSGPPANQKHAYTLVLKGVIALATAVFPKGTTGFALDAFARRALWMEGLDYRHGTGHGVGSYLNVHEGPIGVGTRVAYSEVGLSKGNVLSDEPGYYEDGGWGIRIENIVIVKEIDVKSPLIKPAKAEEDEKAQQNDTTNGSSENKSTEKAPANGDTEGTKEDDEKKPDEKKDEDKKIFLGFETVTMAPYCRALIDASILTPEERKWVDEYHADVRAKVEPLLGDDQRAKKWLIRETEPL